MILEPANGLNRNHDVFTSRNMLILCGLLVIAGLVRAIALPQPWGGDQGVYGYIGWRMMEGQVPYRDLYSSTGYGIFFVNQWAMQIFGTNMFAANLFDYVFYLLTVGALFLFVTRLFGQPVASLSSVLFILQMNGNAYAYLYEGYNAFGTYWYLCQRENFQVLLVLGAVALVYFGEVKNQPLFHLLAGVLIGFSFQFKITAALIFGFAGLYILFNRVYNLRTTGSSREMLFLSAGWAAIPVGTLLGNVPFLWYFYQHGSLEIMKLAVYKHAKIYSGLSRGSVIENLFAGHGAMLREQFAVWLFACFTILLLLRFHRSRKTWLLIGWAVFSYGMMLMQKKFFGYHFILLSAPFAVLAALGIRAILAKSPELALTAAPSRALQMMTAALLVANLGIYGAINARYVLVSLRYIAGQMDRAEYDALFSAYPKHMYSVPADTAVAEFIKAHKREADTLEIVNGGGETVINFLADIRPHSRFTSTWYLLIPELYENEYTANLRHEFMDGIATARPAFLLFVYHDLDHYEDTAHQDLADFCRFVRENYRPVGQFSDARYLYMPIDRAADIAPDGAPSGVDLAK